MPQANVWVFETEAELIATTPGVADGTIALAEDTTRSWQYVSSDEAWKAIPLRPDENWGGDLEGTVDEDPTVDASIDVDDSFVLTYTLLDY
jgi:hypothetical protein